MRLRPSELAPVLTVVFLLTVVVVTGPLVHELGSGTAAADSGTLAGGSADVSIRDPPDENVTLAQGFNTARYVLDTPKTTVVIGNVTGRPMLTFKVQFVELGYSESRILFLSPGTAGRHEVQFPRQTFAPSQVENRAYDGTIEIVLRASGKRVVYQRNVTVTIE